MAPDPPSPPLHPSLSGSVLAMDSLLMDGASSTSQDERSSSWCSSPRPSPAPSPPASPARPPLPPGPRGLLVRRRLPRRLPVRPQAHRTRNPTASPVPPRPQTARRRRSWR
ncbi:hypothetical protein ZWY2020_057807 [Hordeum vulgare]|nr:hypothetical protein ZWY2020_057807 [Hordeum vulgare]